VTGLVRVIACLVARTGIVLGSLVSHVLPVHCMRRGIAKSTISCRVEADELVLSVLPKLRILI
jgi:hypothetical protein